MQKQQKYNLKNQPGEKKTKKQNIGMNVDASRW